MQIMIKRITPVPDKGIAWVTLLLRGENAEQVQKEKYPLLLMQLSELSLQIGEIDEACAERIADASGVCRAYVKGLTSLSYGDRSARELTYKLVQKGSDKAHAEAAVEPIEVNVDFFSFKLVWILVVIGRNLHIGIKLAKELHSKRECLVASLGIYSLLISG